MSRYKRHVVLPGYLSVYLVKTTNLFGIGRGTHLYDVNRDPSLIILTQVRFFQSQFGTVSGGLSEE